MYNIEDFAVKDMVVKTLNEKFFDCWDRGNNLLITSYCFLKRNIDIYKDEGGIQLKLGEEKVRRQVTSIDELRNIFEKLISAATEILQTTPLIPGNKIPYDFTIDESEKNLLVNQLVMDILFDQYKVKSERMTRSGFAKDMSIKLYGNDSQSDAIRKSIEDSMKNRNNRMECSTLKKEIEEVFVAPDMYYQYINPIIKDNPIKKKPRFIWADYFYNQKMITYRQFRRQPMLDSNTSYERLIADLNEYNNFIKKLLPVENESPVKYFLKTMDYYHLEFYKRIDFLLKLAEAMPKIGITEIDKKHFLVKRFHPEVLLPFEKDGNLTYDKKVAYYVPLIMLEEMLYRRIQDDEKADIRKYAISLLKCQIIRAKAYELFKYHVEFVLPNYEGEKNYSLYKSIKDFICRYYDMKSYHESNNIWEKISGIKNWKDVSNSHEGVQIKRILHNFSLANDALFWKLDE